VKVSDQLAVRRRCRVALWGWWKKGGFERYHVLLNPSNPVVQTVVNSMMEDGEYFIFAVDSDEGVTTFRADMGRSALAGLRDTLQRIRHSTTNEAQYGVPAAEAQHFIRFTVSIRL
jgi:hypothetical protein